MTVGNRLSVFQITPLLRYKSHTWQFTHLEWAVHWFGCIHRVVQPLPQSVLEYFHHPLPKETPLSVSGHSPFPPSTRQPPVHFVSRFVHSGYFIEMESYNVWSFVTDFFHLAIMFSTLLILSDSLIILKQETWGFPGGAVVENLPANAGDTGLSPGLGRSRMLRSN